MDLTLFDEAEDEGTFLAEVLGDAPLATVDARLTRIIGQLELSCAETAATVDRTINDIQRSVPRLTFDLQLMREHALLLRFTLDSLTAVKGTTTPEVAAVLDHLAVLDTVKARMEAARDVLREAESWSTLDGEVSALVTEQAFDKAADRLAEAARSMVVFRNTPEYEGRRALLLSLQNSLEASLSTPLVAAIAQRDLKACRAYYGVFAQIQRETEFRNYWFGSRRAPLVSAWSEAALEPLVEYLPPFFTQLDALVAEERAPMAAVFPDPVSTLGMFVQTTLDALTPSLSQRINDVGADLTSLIMAYHAAEALGIQIDRSLHRLESSATGDGAARPSPPLARKDRRTSQHLSMSRRSSARTPSVAGGLELGDPSTDEPRGWEVALFEPFLDWQAEYADLEARQLSQELTRAGIIAESDEGAARRVQEDVLAALGAIEAGFGRCMAFTHGYGTTGFLSSADTFMAKMIRERREAIPRVPVVATTAGNEVVDYSSSDWARFQLALRLLGACQVLTDRLEVLENKIRPRLSILSTTIGHQVPGTTPGALALLRQSTVNSAELAGLLASPPALLLPAARGAFIEMTRACQRLLHDTVLSPLIASLAAYADLPIWHSTDEGSAISTFDLKVPTFSLSPTEVASRLGEGLFNLPRLFEVYADDDALAYGLGTLPFPPQSETELAPVEAWLRSLALAVLDHLTERTLPSLRTLSVKGAAQLACDLAYVSRVGKVLEAESPGLERWRESCEAATKDDVGDDEIGVRVIRLRGM